MYLWNSIQICIHVDRIQDCVYGKGVGWGVWVGWGGGGGGGGVGGWGWGVGWAIKHTSSSLLSFVTLQNSHHHHHHRHHPPPPSPAPPPQHHHHHAPPPPHHHRNVIITVTINIMNRNSSWDTLTSLLMKMLIDYTAHNKGENQSSINSFSLLLQIPSSKPRIVVVVIVIINIITIIVVIILVVIIISIIIVSSSSLWSSLECRDKHNPYFIHEY